MKIFRLLLVFGFLAITPIAFADRCDNNKDDCCEKVEDCDDDKDALVKAIKDLTRKTQGFRDAIEDTEWSSYVVMGLIEQLYDSVKKLTKKAKKDDDKKLKKYFNDVEEAFEALEDAIAETLRDIKRECKKDKSERCKQGKYVYKSYKKLDDAFEDVDDAI